MSRLLPCFLYLCLLSACGGSSGSGGSDSSGSGVVFAPEQIVAPPADEGVTVAGQVTFDFVPAGEGGGLDYNAVQLKPVRGALVQGFYADGSIADQAFTDAEGNYELRVFASRSLRVRVSAMLHRSGLPAWDFRVTDNTRDNALYVMEGSLSGTGTSDSLRDLHASSGWDGERYSAARVAAPFAILDAVYEAMMQVVNVDGAVVFPASQLRWSPANVPVEGDRSQGNITTSSYLPSDGNIYILGSAGNDTDEYDKSVIQHEWAHYLEDQLSRSDSIGGVHSLDALLDMRVAFSEGLANAFAAIASGQPLYSDSSGPQQERGFTFSLESEQLFDRGWFSQNTIGKLIYDIADEANDGLDSIALGFAPIYSTLRHQDYLHSDALISIYVFNELVKQQMDVAAAEQLEAMVASEAIFGSGIYAEGETNDSQDAISIALPVYHSLDVGGSVSLCGNNRQGDYNGLDVRRFARIDILSPGNYLINASKTLGSGERDPDIFVHSQGIIIHQLVSGEVDVENRRVALEPGTYILEVFDFLNVDDFPGGGSSCFDLTVTR